MRTTTTNLLILILLLTIIIHTCQANIFKEIDLSLTTTNKQLSFNTNSNEYHILKIYVSNQTNVQYFTTRFESCKGQIRSIMIKKCNPSVNTCDNNPIWMPNLVNSDYRDVYSSDIKWLCSPEKKCSSQLVYYVVIEADKGLNFNMLTRLFNAGMVL
jgi:hypothetical protein